MEEVKGGFILGGRGFRVYTRAFIGGDTNLGKLGNFEGRYSRLSRIASRRKVAKSKT